MSKVNTANVLFIMVASALVFIMTPGLALFYGGLVPRRNMVNTFVAVFFSCGLAILLWITVGYSLAFSGNWLGLVGNLHALFLHGINLDRVLAGSRIPVGFYVLYQMMFALVTPALFVGAVVGRVRLPFLAAFIAAWSLLVYYPLVHLVWGGGLFQQWGVLDFAGGTVVHVNAGVTALVLSLTVGPRLKQADRHDSPALVLLGLALLWLGWYGFNTGAALAINDVAIQAMLTTTVATAAAIVAWQALELLTRPHLTLIGTCTGALCGLVAITPAAGYVTIPGALAIGLVASLVSYGFVTKLKPRWGIDDTLDAFGCHGISGIWGSVATGLFATHRVNAAATSNGLLYGGGLTLLGRQLLATLLMIGYVFLASWLLITLLRRLLPVRPSARDEVQGWLGKDPATEAFDGQR